jgi:hypothetical protein
MFEPRPATMPSRRTLLTGAAALGATGALGPAIRRPAHAQEPRPGGVLKVAIIGEPPSLDATGRPRA